jgi:hypothetical protein
MHLNIEAINLGGLPQDPFDLSKGDAPMSPRTCRHAHVTTHIQAVVPRRGTSRKRQNANEQSQNIRLKRYPDCSELSTNDQKVRLKDGRSFVGAAFRCPRRGVI